MSLKDEILCFEVVQHHGAHLEVLQEYARLYKTSNGKIHGEISRANLSKAIHDQRLKALDSVFVAHPVQYLIIRIKERNDV